MAPIEDLQARDLAWISDFVMQQMVIMLRPMMEHLQQTDANVDYTQHTVQRLSMDVSEIRSDLERTNKYLAILRQGLGVQNEGKCVLQRGLESTARTVKRMDEQMEGMLEAVRGMEGGIGRLSSDVRSANAKQDDLARQVADRSSAIEDLQNKVERTSNVAISVRDSLLTSEARLEVWQRELRDLRRNQLGIVAKHDDKVGLTPPSSQGCRALSVATETPWSRKKEFVISGNEGTGYSASTEKASSDGSSTKTKRMNRVGSGSGRALQLQQDPGSHLELGSGPPRSSSSRSDCAGTGLGYWSNASEGLRFEDGTGAGDEPASSSRLPLLGARAAMSRPPDSGYSEGPRMRFSATMVKPSSRGSPN